MDPQLQRDNLEIRPARGTVLLPCEPDQFRAFIAGLLGTPQVIERRIFNDFSAGHSDLQNLHHLLMQRMNQQHGMTLIHFTAKILYDDHSNVLLNSFDHFAAHTEIKPLVSTGVVLTWTFLVHFADREHPEKQEIEISFDAKDEMELPVFFLIMDEIALRERYDDWRIKLRISHTARTWGADVESLLTGHLEKLIWRDSEWIGLIRKIGGRLALGFGALVLLSIVFGVLWSSHTLNSELLKNYTSVAQDSFGYQALQEKIDYLVAQFARTQSIKNILSGIIIPAFIVSMWIAAMVARSAKKRGASFLLLTEKAMKRREVEMNKNRWAIVKFVASIGLGVGMGVAANYIFSWMVGGPG